MEEMFHQRRHIRSRRHEPTQIDALCCAVWLSCPYFFVARSGCLVHTSIRAISILSHPWRRTAHVHSQKKTQKSPSDMLQLVASDSRASHRPSHFGCEMQAGQLELAVKAAMSLTARGALVCSRFMGSMMLARVLKFRACMCHLT